mgnify:CR=1 FL=1
MNRRHFLIGSVVAIVAAVAGAFIANRRTALQSASQEAVKALFDREWFSPDQKPISTQDWKNKVLVVNFWASWCPPCVEEMPALSNLQDEFAAKNVLFVGIGIDTPSNIRQFLETTLVSYPIVMGGLQGSKIGKALGNTQGALPYTVIADAGFQRMSRWGWIPAGTI